MPEKSFSKIGLGCWAHGGGGWKYSWGPQSIIDSEETIIESLKKGVNWIDLAPLYGFGKAEIIAGKVLGKIDREKIIICDKVGLVWDEKRNVTIELTEKSVNKQVENSLKRLKTDYIDLMQIHWPDNEGRFVDAWKALVKLKKQQIIREIGVCNFNFKQLKTVNEIAPVFSYQFKYSILHDKYDKQIIDYSLKNNIMLIPYGILAKGLLSGKYTNESIKNLAFDDHRKKDPDFIGEGFKRNSYIIDKLIEISRENEKSILELSISWAFAKIPFKNLLVGMRDPDQLNEILSYEPYRVDDEIIKEIDKLLI